MEDDAEGKALNHIEETEDGPVGEPLNIIMDRWGLKGTEGKESREGPANEIGNRGSKRVGKMEKEDQDDTTEEGVSLGDLGAFLQGN